MTASPNYKLSSGILSVLPSLYVAWADGVLSPTEMKIIHKKINGLDFLTEKDKTYLIKWSNPKNPPSEALFKFWSSQFKKFSASLELDERTSLAELGLEIAQNNIDYKASEIWNSPKTKDALNHLETILGVNNYSSRELLLSQFQKSGTRESQASFNVKKLSDFLDGEFKETKDRMRRLMRDPVFKLEEIPHKEEKRKSVLKQLTKLAEQGISAYAFPKEYGGKAMNGDHMAVFEMLAQHDLSLTVKFGVQFGLFGGAIYQLGTQKHHIKYLETMHKAELLGCFAMTETGHGSNVKGLETTATYDHHTKEITINTPHLDAGKEYIGNAFDSKMAAVFAQLIVDDNNHGVHAILVPIRDENHNLLPGIRIEDCGYKMGLNGVDNGRLWFDNVRVPVDMLLDKYGAIDEKGNYNSPIENPSRRFFTMLGALVLGRICVGLGGVSASKVALYIAIKYALKRRQFGKQGEAETLIMDYPTHQKRLIPLLAKNYAYYAALRELANTYTNADESDIRRIETLAAGLKAKATWLTTDTIQECREACGGKGYLSENRLSDLKADTDIFTTFEGDNTVLMQLVAKGKLTEYRDSFHSDGSKAVMRHLYTILTNKLASLNPVETRNTSSTHLLDRAFHLHAFKYRETKLLIDLSDSMRSKIKKRVDAYQVFLHSQNQMMELAHAYIDRVVLKAFVRMINKATDTDVQAILNKLCDLYALSVIEENSSWYLENDYLEGSKSIAIKKKVAKLCGQLRYDVSGLVDAFSIPEELIAAEIVI